MSSERYARQSFLGANSEAILRSLRVGIVGLGGGGAHVAQQLTHVGVGAFELFDADRVDNSNLNRLVGATTRDIGKLKVDVAARLIRGLNSRARVGRHSCEWQFKAEAMRACDVVVGCVDSFATRNELERAARRFLIPYIDIGMDVYESGPEYSIEGQVALSTPGYACLHCMNVLRADLLQREAQNYGAAGDKPQVVWPNGVLASTAVGLLVKLFCPWHDGARPVALLEYDGNASTVTASSASDFLSSLLCPHFSPDDVGDPWFTLDT